ncbi:hypothetical protein Tco_0578083 [Tanacetum coccineum]
MSTQQDIYAAGSENRPPMLLNIRELCSMVITSSPSSYAKSKPNGKLIYNSIINGPYVRRMIPEPGCSNIGNGNVVAATAEGKCVLGNNGNQISFTTAEDLGQLARNWQQRSIDTGTQTTKLRHDSDDQLGHNNDNCYDNEYIQYWFYSRGQYQRYLPNPLLNHTKYTQKDNVISDISCVEQEGGTVDQHTATVEETRAYFESLYNNLALEVEKVNSVNRKLKETNADLTTELARYKNQEKCFEISQEKYDKLESMILLLCHDSKNTNQQDINAFSAQRLANTHDPLTLMANTQTAFHPYQSSHITYIQHPQPNNNLVQQPSFNTNYMPQPMQNPEDSLDPTTAMNTALALLAKAFKIAQEEEAGIQITQEEFDFMATIDAYEETERVKVNYISEDTLQQASTFGTQSDNAPVYDSDGSTEVPKDENCYDHDIYNMLTHEVQSTDIQTELDQCKYDKISYDKAYNDMPQKIERLQAQLGDLKGKSSDTQCALNTLDLVSRKLEDENVSLEFRVSKPKGTTKGTSTNTVFTKQSILGKLPSSSSSYKKLYSVTPFPKSSVLPKVDKTNALSKPVTSNSVPSTQESRGVQIVNVIAPRIFRTNPSKTFRVDNVVPNKLAKTSIRIKPITVSQPNVIHKQQANSDSNGFSSTRVNNTAKTRRPHPRSNSNTDRVSSKSKSSCLSNNIKKIEENH